MKYQYDLSNLPYLLKRHHFIETFGISSPFYYRLIKKNVLPVIMLNGRKYVDRNKFVELLNNGSFGFMSEGDKDNG